MITNPLVNTKFGVLSLRDLLSAMWQAGYDNHESYPDVRLNEVYLATIEDIATACFITINKTEVYENLNRPMDESGASKQAGFDANDSMAMPFFDSPHKRK